MRRLLVCLAILLLALVACGQTQAPATSTPTAVVTSQSIAPTAQAARPTPLPYELEVGPYVSRGYYEQMRDNPLLKEGEPVHTKIGVPVYTPLMATVEGIPVDSRQLAVVAQPENKPTDIWGLIVRVIKPEGDKWYFLPAAYMKEKSGNDVVIVPFAQPARVIFPIEGRPKGWSGAKYPPTPLPEA